MKGWAELDLEGKTNTVWAVAGIAVCLLTGYVMIRSMQTHKKIEKRLHIDGDNDE